MNADPAHRATDWSPAPRPGAGDCVVVGVSGGVDSSVAAQLLVDRGCEVIAVTTKNFCVTDPRYDLGGTAGSCCSEEATARAAELCQQLGIPHSVLDVADLFHDEVIADYVREYSSGSTPSPCVRCNQLVRFPELLGFAKKIGAQWVATGHYANRVQRNGELYVAQGRDADKDQAYHLSRVFPELLSMVDFPLGELTKAEVREVARRHGLPAATTPDSQELCFVPDGRRERVLPTATPGEVVDRKGRVLGQHRGIAFFTPGQRRGLGLGGQDVPQFVVELDPERNRVVVGPESDLNQPEILVADAVLRDPRPGAPGLRAKTRANHPGTEVASLTPDGSRFRLRFLTPDRAPAPGQALVLYRDGVVVGSGRIVRDEDRQ